MQLAINSADAKPAGCGCPPHVGRATSVVVGISGGPHSAVCFCRRFGCPRASLRRCWGGGPLRLRLLVVTIITFTAAVVHSAAPNKSIKLFASCTTTLLPKRCSFLVSALSKGLDKTRVVIAGPQLAAGKLKSDPCVPKCSQVVSKISQLVQDVATSYTTYAEGIRGVFQAMLAIEKFLAELQPLTEVTSTVKDPSIHCYCGKLAIDPSRANFLI